MTEPNSTHRANWNGDSGQLWAADADRRDRILAPVLDVLLGAARIQPPEDILDIGCGCGATTLAAAGRLTTGTATGLDLSQPMLQVARQRAEGRDRVSFVEADAQTYALEPAASLVMSRFGTMFFDDPAAAFGNLRRAVRDGGRLCIATWQPLAANEWLLVPEAVLDRYGPQPDVPGPGMFSQSDPAAVGAILTGAGWERPDVEPHEVFLRIGSDPADAADYLAGTGSVRRVLDALDPGQRSAALADLTAALSDHVTDGVRLKAGIHIVQAHA
jgi:SAM-dependent methyltransferase